MIDGLLEPVREGRIRLPRIVVNFAGADIATDIATDIADVGEISSLDAPHRVFDAILRDSNLDGLPQLAGVDPRGRPQDTDVATRNR